MKALRIAALDPDAQQRALLIRTLGYPTRSVEGFDREGALRQALAQRRIDLLILAWEADSFDSPALLQWLREGEHADLRVLVLSRSSSADDGARALRLGADDFVSTPFRVVELAARVGRLLGKPQSSPP